MSNYLVISAVTAVLKYILEREIQDELDTPLNISLRAPHTIASEPTENGLNIFLFEVSKNLGYVNYDLPMRDDKGQLISKPLVGLDLHYLLTPYSVNNDEILVQQILASAVRILNENSVLTRQIISNAFESIRTSDPTNKILNSDLSEQSEIVKLSYKPLSVEEITKLWSSYSQTNYRLSVAYIASPVLIDSKKEPIQSLPVQERKIIVSQFRYPIIDRIEPSVIQWDPDAANRNILILGKNLNSDNLRVFIGKSEIPSTLLSEISNERITLNLPDDLPPGVKTLKIVHGISNDSSGLGLSFVDLAFESNTSIFVLAPRIITAFPIQVVRGTNIDLEFKPPSTEKQRIEIIIGEKSFPQNLGNVQSFPIETIDIGTNAFPVGKFLFRLRIDGAASFLLSDPDPSSSNYKKYIGPEIKVVGP